MWLIISTKKIFDDIDCGFSPEPCAVFSRARNMALNVLNCGLAILISGSYPEPGVAEVYESDWFCRMVYTLLF